MNFLKRFLFMYILLSFIFCLNISSIAKSSTYVWSNNSDKIDTSTINSTKETNAEPTNPNNSIDLKLESTSAILIEQTTGQVLYEHNVHEKLRPASVTKIMSILLIMEQIDSR